MRKVGLYAGIIILSLLLDGCRQQGNENRQDNIGTKVRESVENICVSNEIKNEITVSVSDIVHMEEEIGVSENSIVEINESATVSDSNFTLTLGMLFKDFHYDQEEILSEVTPNNYIGFITIDGIHHDWYFHKYTDLELRTSDYNPVISDMSGKNVYIMQIILRTPRFCTSKGITVGVTIDELKEVYGSENLELLDEDVLERTRYSYVEGNVLTDFYVEEEQVTEIWLHYNY